MVSLKSQTLKQKQPNRFAKTLPEGVVPVSVAWNDLGEPAAIKFSDGSVSSGSCIRCIDPPCMQYSEQELELAVFKDFPADKNNNVCPTGAITWPTNVDAPIINPEYCILCGLCVRRCPVRAIYLTENSAIIIDEPNAKFRLQDFSADPESIGQISEMFNDVQESGAYFLENDGVLKDFRNKFEEVAKDQGAQFPNHVARNLLIATGVGTAMRRRGDTNIRMDLVLGPPGVEQGTGEVELGYGVLDAPRNILDNIAVLVGRYEISKDKIIPVVVCLDLPNQRSEYWQVIKDVKEVLDVNINTITIGSLVVLVWNRTKIELSIGNELYIDVDSPSLRPHLESILGRPLNIVEGGYPGFLESEK